jgi:hypothetical protein
MVHTTRLGIADEKMVAPSPKGRRVIGDVREESGWLERCRGPEEIKRGRGQERWGRRW